MVSRQDYDVQLDALEQLQHFLNEFREELEENKGKYMDKVNNMQESGLTVQISDNYKNNYCDPTISEINKIIEDISERHAPFVKENIARVNDAKEAASKY